MSSVSGLLVPNNFDIFANSLTTVIPITSGSSASADALTSNAGANLINVSNAANPGAGQVLTASDANNATWVTPTPPPAPEVTLTNAVALTNKDMTDQSNDTIANGLWSAFGANAVDVRTANTPLAGQVLTAISGAQADWQTPVGNGTQLQEMFSGTYANGGPAVLWTSPALADGVYACTAITSAKPPNINGISSYRSVACVWVTGGVAANRGAGISDNLGGVGSGVIGNNPVFGVSGATIQLLGGDTGAGTSALAGTISLYYLNA